MTWVSDTEGRSATPYHIVGIEGIGWLDSTDSYGTLYTDAPSASVGTGTFQSRLLQTPVYGDERVNLFDGVTDLGGGEIELHDQDGALTSLFAFLRTTGITAFLHTDYEPLSADGKTLQFTPVAADTTPFPASSVIYLDAETIKLGTISGTTYINCVRGYLGSTAEQHIALYGETAGDTPIALPKAYSYLPNLEGRKIAIWSSYVGAALSEVQRVFLGRIVTLVQNEDTTYRITYTTDNVVTSKYKSSLGRIGKVSEDSVMDTGVLDLQVLVKCEYSKSSYVSDELRAMLQNRGNLYRIGDSAIYRAIEGYYRSDTEIKLELVPYSGVEKGEESRTYTKGTPVYVILSTNEYLGQNINYHDKPVLPFELNAYGETTRRAGTRALYGDFYGGTAYAVSRNPIDLFLALATSDPDGRPKYTSTLSAAIAIGDTTATITGATFTTDQWVGYALFARKTATGSTDVLTRRITSNTATVLTFTPSSGVACASGNAIEIRNSIYDLLPLGFGWGLRPENIDCTSFEAIRDRYLSAVDLKHIYLGGTFKDDLKSWAEKSLWKLLGCYTYTAVDGRMRLAVMAPPLPGVSLTTYTTAHILERGQLNYNFANTIKEVHIKYGINGKTDYNITSVSNRNSLNYPFAHKTVSITSDFMSADAESVLIDLAVRLVELYELPMPYIDITFDIRMRTVTVGSYLKLTLANVPDITSTTLGWTAKKCLVVGRKFNFSEKQESITFTLAFFDSQAGNYTYIAPCCNITAWDSVNKILTVTQNMFLPPSSAGSENADTNNFAINDRIKIITSAGANKATNANYVTAKTATTVTLNAEPTAYTWASGDTLTFADYAVATVTTNMTYFSANGASDGYIDSGNTVLNRKYL